MATYRTGRWENSFGVKFYSIEKKTWFGWTEMNYWVISRDYGYTHVQSDDEAKAKMNEAVKRLVKAGHTVI
jgi:hypothetical protein